MATKEEIRKDNATQFRACLTDVVQTAIVLGKPGANLELAINYLCDYVEDVAEKNWLAGKAKLKTDHAKPQIV